MTKRIYSTASVAAMLGLSYDNLQQMIHRGQIKKPRKRAGKFYVWTTTDVARARKIIRDRECILRRLRRQVAVIESQNAGPVFADRAVPDWRMEFSPEQLSGEQLLTAEQLAERLAVKPSWITSQIRTRARKRGSQFPVVRLGKYVRFRWPEVVRWINEQAA